MKSFEYAAPESLEEAISLLASQWGEAEILAGGTDLVTCRDPQALADAIYFYYTHTELSGDHGTAAKLHIEREFHIDRTISETEAMFRSLL
jgi:dihydrofolate reductase